MARSGVPSMSSAVVSDFRFVEPLCVHRKLEGNGALFYVTQDYTVEFKIDGEPVTYTVPAETPTDFASIPRIVQNLVQVLGPHIEAAVVHDHLCIRRGPWSSRVAADIFLAAMEAAGVEYWKRTAMHRAVVRFGPQW